jgi:HD-like signal output (HDOD) protein
MSEQLLAKVASLVDDLPSLPAVAQEVLAMLSDPSTKPESLQASLSRDPALSLKVLRISNSAYYRRGREITSLADAIVLLGFKTVQSLVMSSAVHRVLSSAGGIAAQLWEHCFAVGAACREVAALNGARMMEKEEAFMVGLFHDVGKGIIGTKFPGIYKAGIGVAGETEQLGFNHAELAGVLLEKWDIPDDLTQSVLMHHDPAPQGKAAYVTVANWLCEPTAPGISDGPRAEPTELIAQLNIGPDDILDIRERVEQLVAEERGG